MEASTSDATHAPYPEVYPYPPARQGWTAVAILSLLYVLSMMDRNVMVLLSDAVAKDLHLTDIQLGFLYGPAFAILYAVVGLPMGWAIDRYPRRWVIWFGVVSWSIATISCGFSRTFWQLFLARSGVGAGEAVLTPGSQSIIADSFPPNRYALPMSIYGLGNKVGSGLSFILGGMLIFLFPANATYELTFVGDMKGWQVIFFAAGLPGIVLGFLVFIISEPRRRTAASIDDTKCVSFRDYFDFARNNLRFMSGYHLGTVTIMIVSIAITAWTPAYFVRVHGWPSAEVGLWLGAAMLAGPLIFLPVHGVMIDRLFRKGVRDAHMIYLKFALLTALAPATLAYNVSNPWISLGLISLSQTILAVYIVLLPTTLQLFVPGSLRGKAASMALFLGGLGGVGLGPTVIAILTDQVFQDRQQVGLSIALCIGVGLPVAFLLLTMAQRPMRERMGVLRVPFET